MGFTLVVFWDDGQEMWSKPNLEYSRIKEFLDLAIPAFEYGIKEAYILDSNNDDVRFIYKNKIYS